MKQIKYPNQGDNVSRKLLDMLTMALSCIGFTAAILCLLVFL